MNYHGDKWYEGKMEGTQRVFTRAPNLVWEPEKELEDMEIKWKVLKWRSILAKWL